MLRLARKRIPAAVLDASATCFVLFPVSGHLVRALMLVAAEC